MKRAKAVVLDLLTEAVRIPNVFHRDADNWVKCEGGSVCVSWKVNRWWIKARGYRTMSTDDNGEMRMYVQHACKALGGTIVN